MFEPPELPRVGLGFKLWFAFCALVGLAIVGVLIWAVIMLVNHVTR